MSYYAFFLVGGGGVGVKTPLHTKIARYLFLPKKYVFVSSNFYYNGSKTIFGGENF